MKGIATGSIAAAIAVFIWGFLFWGTAIADPFDHVTPEQETTIAANLSTGFSEPGVYSIPDQANGTEEEWIARHEAGPVAIVRVRPEGVNPMAPAKMAGGFVHMLVSIAFMAAALRLTNLQSYGQRLQLVLVTALAGTTFATLTDPIWFHATWGYFVWLMIYYMISWLIAGAILARFIKPEAGASNSA